MFSAPFSTKKSYAFAHTKNYRKRKLKYFSGTQFPRQHIFLLLSNIIAIDKDRAYWSQYSLRIVFENANTKNFRDMLLISRKP